MNVIVTNSVKIGGVNVVVEIDESKFGKMKFGRGKPMNGQMGIGGIERRMDKCLFSSG